jgi:hypothetical protein
MLRRLVSGSVYISASARSPKLAIAVTVRKAVLGVMAGQRFSGATADRHAHMSPTQRKLAKDVEDYKEGSELERIDEVGILLIPCFS